MGIDSVLQSGLQAIYSGGEKAAKAATEIATSFASGGDAVGPIVDMKLAEREVKAGATLIRVGDELSGALLDIMA